MNFKLIQFDNLLKEIKEENALEENLSKIIRDIVIEFEYQSLGVFLKNVQNDQFRLKINRHLTHRFEKNAIYTSDDDIVKKLYNLQPLEFRNPETFKFEKSYSHLIVAPLSFKERLLGFIFIDRKEGLYEEEDITKLCMFASIISLIVKIFHQQHELEQMTEIDKITNVLSYRAFIKNGERVFSQVKRYKRDLTLAVFKISNYTKLLRIYGKNNINQLYQNIADIMKSYSRQSDIIGKTNNDAFTILMPETNIEKVKKPISRISQRIKELPQIMDIKFGWGLVSISDSANNIVELHEKAEKAVFEALRLHKEFVRYADIMK